MERLEDVSKSIAVSDMFFPLQTKLKKATTKAALKKIIWLNTY
jgi:hypothetical protein